MVTENSIRVALLAGIVIAISTAAAPVPGAQLKSEDVVRIAQAAMKRIETIQGRFREMYGNLQGPGVVHGPQGEGVMLDLRWVYDRRTGREAFAGKNMVRFHDEKVAHYDDVRMAYDGKVLRTWGRRGNGGTIRELKGDLRVWGTPNRFLGFMYGELPTRNLWDMLDGARLIELPNTPADLYVLRLDCRRGREDDQLTIWLDSKHGFLPKRIERVRKDSQTISRITEVDKFYQAPDGTWVPIRGRDTIFALEEVSGLPKGMSLGQLAKLPELKQKAIRSKLKVRTKALGLGTLTYLLDTDGLIVNAPLRDDQFTLEFPKGTYVWNDFDKRGYQVGRFDDPSRVHFGAPRANGRRHEVLVFALMGVLLCLVVVLIWRRRRSARVT